MLGVVDFDVRTPASPEVLRARVAENLQRGLPEAEPAPDHDGVLTIIANGPSAAQARPSGPVLAVNGAIRLLTPTFWACCDPQALVAGFLTEPPMATRYFVASKCDPAVFDALEGRDVTLWHIDDSHPAGVPSASSITLSAMSLFRSMGWRRFRTWGWDGCYIDGRDHAAPQAHARQDITLLIGEGRNEQAFRTTPTWACEAQDAVVQLAMADYEVEVMGGGMIGAILRAVGVIRT